MAKLPDVEINSVEPQGSGIGAVTAAQQKFVGTISEGLSAYSQELVKTEIQRAAVKLTSKLNDVENEIDTNKTVSTQYLREKLGADYDSLPEHVRSSLTEKGINVQTGELEDIDREDIPMWQVSGAMYDALSRRALVEASDGIPMAGWKADFQDRVASEIENRKAKLASTQLTEMHRDLSQQQTKNALALAQSGAYGPAYAVIQHSRVMDQGYKDKLTEEVGKIQDTAPIFDAIRKDDYGSMAQLVGQLNDPEKFTRLSPQEREQYSERLKGEIKQFNLAARQEQEQRQKAYDDLAAKNIYTTKQLGQPISYKMIPLDVSAEAQKNLMAYVDATNKGEEPKTNYRVFAGLYEMVKNGKPVMLTQYLGSLSGPDFKTLLEMQLNGKAGSPKFDKFVTTDEEINTQLRGIPGLDPSAVKDEKMMEKVGYVKSVIQRDLFDAQQSKPGQADLTPEERATVIATAIKREVDPKKHWYSSTDLPAHSAGVPARIVPDFRRAVSALGFKNPNTEETLKAAYSDYQTYEPGIELAWQQIRGANILPSQSISVWYYLNANLRRLEGRLKETNGDTKDKDLRLARLAAMAVQEMSSR